MAIDGDPDLMARVREFFEQRIGKHLPRREQREAFACYAMGRLGDGERKSAEAIAARASCDGEECRKLHDKLLHFLRRSKWSDWVVRQEALAYFLDAAKARGETVDTWIIDDTGFLKQGIKSPGVQRQYTGSAGKVANCQIGVSLVLATATQHVAADMELYLPKNWLDDRQRCREANIPDTVVFRTKTQIAAELVSRAVSAGLPGEVVLMDSAYGVSGELRDLIRRYGLELGVAIRACTKVWTLDSREQCQGDAESAGELGQRLGRKAFRRFVWREGTSGKLQSRFCFRRVKVASDDAADTADREPMWLVIEWPDGEPNPTKFVLTTLPARWRKKRIIRLFKERWRTERTYQDLKGELGLDHFEGRSFPGWNHHISVAICCHAFLVADCMRRFSPSAAKQSYAAALHVAA